MLKLFVIEFNMFQQHGSDQRQVTYQRLATRLYIFFTAVSLAIVIFYSLLSTSIHRETVLNPVESRYIELQENYPNTLTCLCDTILMNYSTFITIEPYYHQLCSSDLISDEWIEYHLLYYFDLVNWYTELDYRLNAATQFQSLAIFCDEAKKTIDNTLRVFKQTDFASSRVIARSVLELQAHSLIENWRSTTVNSFLNTFELARAITQGNQLMQKIYNITVVSKAATIWPITFGNCSCAVTQSCAIPMSMYTVDPFANTITELYVIPQFFVGCFPLDALFTSTLQCFYNKSCMMAIDQYMFLGQSGNFSPLDYNRNWPYERIESIVYRLMVDRWETKVSFSSYYETCAPSSCVFEYERGIDFFSLATSIIGVLGGLSLGWKIILRITLKLIKTIAVRRFHVPTRHLVQQIFICHDDQQKIHRLHRCLVATILVVLYTFSAFSPRPRMVEMQNPSLGTYPDLLVRYSSSLRCSCSEVSIPYQSFFTAVPYFDAVCESDFISDRWIAYLYAGKNLSNHISLAGFQSVVVAQFQLLASLCHLSKKIINTSLTEQSGLLLIQTRLLSPSELDEHMRTTLDAFRRTTSNAFLSTLSLIRQIMGANMLLSAWSTNWIISTPSQIDHLRTAHTIPLIYQGCNCGLSSQCVQQAGTIFLGCYPLDGLLVSTLKCLYDQQCIDPTNTFQALNSTADEIKKYHINDTLQSLVSQYMVQDYVDNVSYEKYFAACKPSSCTYLIIDRSRVVESLANLITIYGGLLVVCRLVAVTIIRIFSRVKLRVVSPFK